MLIWVINKPKIIMLVLLYRKKRKEHAVCKNKALNSTQLKNIILVYKSEFWLGSMKVKLSIWVTAKYSLGAMEHRH